IFSRLASFPAPLAAIRNNWITPERYTMRLPSGDQVGWVPPEGVRRVLAPRVNSNTQVSTGFELRTTVTRVASGESAISLYGPGVHTLAEGLPCRSYQRSTLAARV